MKKRMAVSGIILAMMCSFAFGHDSGCPGQQPPQPPPPRPEPALIGACVMILMPTAAPLLVTPPGVTSIVLGGVVGDVANVARITYASSAGDNGACEIVTNKLWRSPMIPLVLGSNLVTVTAVYAGQPGATASDDILIIGHEAWTNRPPACTNRPPVSTNPPPPVCTNRPPAITNWPPIIVSRPPVWWGTNEVYRYLLRAIDRENDALTLALDTRGPVLANVTPVTNGAWLISAVLTSNVPVVSFDARVSDGGPRPANQHWFVIIPRRELPVPGRIERVQEALILWQR
jgi:hypothetical protein